MDLSPAVTWTTPPGWDRVTVVDAHTGGEPFRVVVDGLPDIPGADMASRRSYAIEHLDDLRRSLMWEPRGHADMYGGWIGPALGPANDLSVLFTHNEGFSTMCGHGIIALVKVVLDTGILPIGDAPKRTIAIDTPAGPVVATASVKEGSVTSVRFRNVPSFVERREVAVATPGFGDVVCDIAYGGAFYAFVDAAEAGVDIGDPAVLVRAGREIKAAVSERGQPEHPERSDLSFLYGVIFTGAASQSSHHSRQVCVFADGEIDRSPTGTGVSARLALLHDSGAITVGETIEVESIVSSVFAGRIVDTTRAGRIPAVIPEIEGIAHLIGRYEMWFDPGDPLRGGFFLR
jgi:trans-L-3-hydroxyproline dehydratase